MQTLILLDNAIYITSNYNRLIAESQERVAASIQKEIEAQNKFNDKIAKLKAELED